MANPFGFVGGPMPTMGPMGGPMSTASGPMPMTQIGPQIGPMPPMPPPPPPGQQQQATTINMVDPATNNQPLQFNMAKGKPPMPVSGSLSPPPPNGTGRARSLEPGVIERGSEAGQQLPNQVASNAGPQPDMLNPMGMMGNWAPMMGPMMGDPSMMMGPMGYGPMGFMGPMGPMGPGMEQRPKEIMNLTSMTLYPPPPNAPPQTTRERPPGCRTVFIGGLPANLTEEQLREIFDECGGICSIRMSTKNFAHVRFEAEECVDKALFYSGYRIKIENKDDAPNTGRLHVDYAQARDDLYEWECQQRALAREHRHRQRLEEERLRPPSPPPITHFSDHEASLLQENLKGDESFVKASQILITWLERGDCNRRSSNSFYSMVQSVNSHIRRLMNEKAAHDDEFEIVKQQFRDRLEGVLRQFEQIEKVFTAASKQKAWDHFSKAQRKNLDIWRKQCQEIRHSQEREFLKDRQEAEMEMSDSEDNDFDGQPSKKPKIMDFIVTNALKEENDNLKCQLEAYKNEVHIMRSEQQGTVEEKDKQLKALQHALQGMQRQLMEAKQQIKEHEDQPKVVIRRAQENTNSPEASDENTEDAVVTVVSSSREYLGDREARLIALVSTFLHVHPFGASVDYILSYLQQVGIKIRTSEIEDLLEKLPSVYRQDILGVGACIEKRWKFIGFSNA